MLCTTPYFPPGTEYTAFPCGSCVVCRKGRRRLWSDRMLLEAMEHEKNSFLTLTYNEKHLPRTEDGGLPTLKRRDVQLFFKRLRDALAPVTFRYYYVGEYGSQTWRPHYHAALFGIGPESERLISEKWSVDGEPMGFVKLGTLEPASAAYIASYLKKGLLRADNPKLDGRAPEFAQPSTRPGIGVPALMKVVDTIVATPALMDIVKAGDVPTHLKIGEKSLLLGRHLRRKLRELLDIYFVCPVTGEVKYGSSQGEISQRQQELRSLFEDWLDNPKNSQKSFKSFVYSVSSNNEREILAKLDFSRKGSSL